MTQLPTPGQWARMSWHQRQQLLHKLRIGLGELTMAAQADNAAWDAYKLRHAQAQLRKLERAAGQPP